MNKFAKLEMRLRKLADDMVFDSGLSEEDKNKVAKFLKEEHMPSALAEEFAFILSKLPRAELEADWINPNVIRNAFAGSNVEHYIDYDKPGTRMDRRWDNAPKLTFPSGGGFFIRHLLDASFGKEWFSSKEEREFKEKILDKHRRSLN